MATFQFHVTPALSGMSGMSAMVSGSGYVFDWEDYLGVEARYDATDITTMYSNTSQVFDGTHGLVSRTAPVTAVPFTVCCWVKNSNSIGSDQIICYIGDKDDGNHYSALVKTTFANGNKLRLRHRVSGTDDDVASVAAINDGTWHFCAGVWASNTSRIVYLDSAAGVEDTTSLAIAGTYDTISFGYAGILPDGTLHFVGSLAYPMVFSAALSAAQITWLYNSGNGRTYEELVTSTDTDNPGIADLEGVWPLSEYTDTRTDTLGTHNLSEDTVARVATFDSAIPESLANTASAPVTTMPFSVSGWVRGDSTDTGANGVVFSLEDTAGNNYYIVAFNTLDSLFCKKRDGSTTEVCNPLVSYRDDSWHFFTAVYTSATSMTFWIDHDIESTNTNSLTPTGINRMRLGIWTTLQAFKGEMSQMMIHEKSLTKSEHLWLYNSGRGRTTAEINSSTHVDNPGNPEHLWELDEASGNRLDTYGSYTLTDVNTVLSEWSGPVNGTLPTVGAGPIDVAIDFEDGAQYFERNSSMYFEADTAAFTGYGTTIALWMKTGYRIDTTVAFSCGNKDSGDEYVRIGTSSGGFPYVSRRQSGGSQDFTFGATRIDDGQWHFVAAVLTATNDIDFYVDDEVAVNDTTSVTLANFDRTSIGRSGASTPGSYFEGALDEVAVFGSALSAANIATLYNNGRGTLVRGMTTPATPTHSWSLCSNNLTSPGEDLVGSLDLTATNSPYSTSGIPAGQIPTGIVARMDDQSGNANTLSQATYAKRPALVRVSDGTGVAVVFDGTDDWLDCPTFAGGALSQPNDIFLVASIPDTPNATKQTLDSSNSASRHSIFTVITTDALSMLAGTNLLGTAVDTANHVILAEYNTTASKLFKDGGSPVASGDAGSNTMIGLVLGAQYDGAAAFSNATVRQVVVHDGALTDTERDNIGTELATTHGLTWTDVA